MGAILAVLGVLLALLVGAALLQLSVSGANRLASGGDSNPAARYRARARDLEAEWDKWDWDEWDDDRAPLDPEPVSTKTLIPKPNLGLGMAVVFLTAAIGLLAFVLINFTFFDSGGRGRYRDRSGAAFLLTLPIAYFALSVLLVAFLPTTLRRALLVALVFALSILGFCLSVGVLIFVLSSVLR